MSKPVKIARVYISESEKGKKESLYKELFHLLHEGHKVHGVTVFRGIAGFGSKGEVHSADLLRMTASLPLVIEFFDDPKTVDAALAELAQHVPPAHIVSWQAECP